MYLAAMLPVDGIRALPPEEYGTGKPDQL